MRRESIGIFIKERIIICEVEMVGNVYAFFGGFLETI